MGKIRSISDLQDALDNDLSWRKKEIQTIYSFLRPSAGDFDSKNQTVVRTSIPIIYAHWEGFVKNASSSYLDYVCRSSLKTDKVSDNFLYLHIRKDVIGLASSDKIELGIGFIKNLKNSLRSPEKLSISTVIDTKSNLSSTVFSEIIKTLGFKISDYETKFHFIDESLVNRRNKIAHGEYLDLTIDGLNEIRTITLGLMQQVKTDIENAASTQLVEKPVA